MSALLLARAAAPGPPSERCQRTQPTLSLRSSSLRSPAKSQVTARDLTSGTEPAYNVKVWVRSSDPDSIRMQNFRVMEPGDHRDVVAEDVPAHIQAEVPGRLLEGTPELLDHWVAVEWEGAHGVAYSVMEIQQRRGGALPRPL